MRPKSPVILHHPKVRSADDAWERAADCAAQAEEAATEELRRLYNSLRDAWIQVANNLEILHRARSIREEKPRVH